MSPSCPKNPVFYGTHVALLPDMKKEQIMKVQIIFSIAILLGVIWLSADLSGPQKHSVNQMPLEVLLEETGEAAKVQSIRKIQNGDEALALSSNLEKLRQKRLSYKDKLRSITAETIDDKEVEILLEEVQELDRKILEGTEEVLRILREA